MCVRWFIYLPTIVFSTGNWWRVFQLCFTGWRGGRGSCGCCVAYTLLCYYVKTANGPSQVLCRSPIIDLGFTRCAEREREREREQRRPVHVSPGQCFECGLPEEFPISWLMKPLNQNCDTSFSASSEASKKYKLFIILINYPYNCLRA
jgi:hypothetical protein